MGNRRVKKQKRGVLARIPKSEYSVCSQPEAAQAEDITVTTYPFKVKGVEQDNNVGNIFLAKRMSETKCIINSLKSVDKDRLKENADKINDVIDSTFSMLLTALENLDLFMDNDEETVNLEQQAIRNYLGTNDVFQYGKQYVLYKHILILYVMHKLIEDKTFECVKKYLIRGDEILKPEYTDVQIDYNKFVKVISAGYFQLKYKGEKFCVSICVDCDGRPRTYLEVMSDEKKKNKVDVLMKAIEDGMEKYNFYKGKKLEVHAGCYLEIMPPINKTWDDIIVDQIIKDEINDNIINMIDKKDVYKANKIPLKRGIILSGSYGLGKTLLCQILCEDPRIESTKLFITPKALCDPDMVKKVYEVAVELSPTIIILEDLDTFGKDREYDGGYKENILGELMNQLSGIREHDGVITVATTNRIGIIEKALKERPDRFDRVLHFGLPNEDQRKLMLERFLKNYSKSKDIVLEHWAEKTKDFSGVHLKDFVKTAVIQAVVNEDFVGKSKKVRLTNEHFEKAFDRINKVSHNRIGFKKDE